MIFKSQRRVKIKQNEINILQIEMRKRPIILPIQLRWKQNNEPKMPQYAVIPENIEHGGSGDATVVSIEMIMEFQKNTQIILYNWKEKEYTNIS